MEDQIREEENKLKHAEELKMLDNLNEWERRAWEQAATWKIGMNNEEEKVEIEETPMHFLRTFWQ